MLRECFMAGLKISKLQGFVLKSMQGWLDGKVIFPIQMLPTFGGRCNRYFWDVRLKIFRLPNFNMLFQLVLTKLSCFRIYRKWSRDQVMQRASVGRPCCVSRGKTLFTILIRRNIFLTGEKKYPSLLCVWKFTVQLFVEYIIKQILNWTNFNIHPQNLNRGSILTECIPVRILSNSNPLATRIFMKTQSHKILFF